MLLATPRRAPNSRACLLASALCLFAATPVARAQFVSRGPYVQMTSEDSAAVVWRTVGGTIPIVRYGPAPGVVEGEVLPVGTVIKLGPDVPGPPGLPRLHSAPLGTIQYEASIFGLDPDTTYFYGVFDDDILLAGDDADHHFTTLPQAGSETSLRLWVTGDTGEGSASQIAAYEAMKQFVAQDGREVDAYLHLGDMAYESGFDDEFSDHFFAIYEDMLCNTVTWPTMGNHEGFTSNGVTQVGPYYDSYVVPTQGEVGGVPSGTEAYYSFDIGRAHFICLDSYDLDRSPTGEMALWLKADLEMAQGDWIIAFWHHPPYTKGTHDSDFEIELVEMREMIMPILESGGVDVVLCGHSHIYERSMLIDSAYETPTVAEGVIFDDGDGDPAGDGAYRKSAGLLANQGTLAVVAGHGEGAGFAFGTNPVMRAVSTEVGSLILDIDGDTLTGQMINSDGVRRDRFRLIKRGVVEQQVVSEPWQPVGPSFVVERFEPGATQVEIFPMPPANDSVIHYAMDGAQPSLESPVFTAPVPIADSGLVSAFSTWRGGERQSLTAGSQPLPERLTIHRYPATADDDAFEDEDGVMELDGETLLIGQDGIAGLRFSDVRIPCDAHLVRAYVHFYKGATSNVPTQGEVRAELAFDSAPFTAAPMDISSRTTTAAAAPWIVRTWSGVAKRDLNTITPDLCELVQEVIDQPGWEPGNAMSFFFHHTGDRNAGAFDDTKTRAATLSLIFIDPEGLPERLALQPPSFERFPNGIFAITLPWPNQEAADQFGLGFEVEVSNDLRTWRTIEPFDSEVIAVGDDGFGELFAEVDPQEFEGAARFFVRLRVVMGAGG